LGILPILGITYYFTPDLTLTELLKQKNPATMKKRILIVDDEADVNFAVKMALEENDFRVDAFDDPELALENLKAGLYDLLILDIKMPKMNGFELCREIRKIDKNVRIFFLTAGMYQDIFDQNQFIRKPIENSELIRRVKGALEVQ
jgi:DNA-binding response OmpR family regulator